MTCTRDPDPDPGSEGTALATRATQGGADEPGASRVCRGGGVLSDGDAETPTIDRGYSFEIAAHQWAAECHRGEDMGSAAAEAAAAPSAKPGPGGRLRRASVRWRRRRRRRRPPRRRPRGAQQRQPRSRARGGAGSQRVRRGDCRVCQGCAGARGAAVSGVEPATARGVDDRRRDGAAAATGRARRLAVESRRDPTARRAARRRAAAGSGSLGPRISPLKMKVAVPAIRVRALDAERGRGDRSRRRMPAEREDTVSYVQTLPDGATRDALRMRGRSPRGAGEKTRRAPLGDGKIKSKSQCTTAEVNVSIDRSSARAARTRGSRDDPRVGSCKYTTLVRRMMRGEGSGERRAGLKGTTRREGAHGLTGIGRGPISRRWRRAKSLVCSRVHDLGRPTRSLPSRSITAAIRRQRT